MQNQNKKIEFMKYNFYKDRILVRPCSFFFDYIKKVTNVSRDVSIRTLLNKY